MNLPEVSEIHRWHVEPGDRLIVRAARVISDQQADYLKERVRHALALPDDFPVLVTGPDLNVEVASSDEENIRDAMAEAQEHPGRIVTR